MTCPRPWVGFWLSQLQAHCRLTGVVSVPLVTPVWAEHSPRGAGGSLLSQQAPRDPELAPELTWEEGDRKPVLWTQTPCLPPRACPRGRRSPEQAVGFAESGSAGLCDQEAPQP